MTDQFGPTLLATLTLCAAACASDEPDPSFGSGAPETGVSAALDGGVPISTASGNVNVPVDAGFAGFDGARAPSDGAVSVAVSGDAATTVDSATSAPRDSGTDGSFAPDAEVSRDAGTEDSGPVKGAPSAGCGKSGRPSAGRISVSGDHNYTFPESYDGRQPFPLLIGFHAAGNPIDQIENLTKGSDFEKKYVRAFPKSKGNAWDYASDMSKVIAMYDDLMANHCIDTGRIFATGHSSGAQLIVQILTPAHKSDADHFKFRAVAPVAASKYGTVSRAIPVLYVQGQHDSVRNSDGNDVVKEFLAANGCMSSSKPYATAPMCTSGGKTVNAGCLQYEGCKEPTVWCSHDDPAYSNTNHGWPCFAAKAIADFFSTLP